MDNDFPVIHNSGSCFKMLKINCFLNLYLYEQHLLYSIRLVNNKSEHKPDIFKLVLPDICWYTGISYSGIEEYL